MARVAYIYAGKQKNVCDARETILHFFEGPEFGNIMDDYIVHGDLARSRTRLQASTTNDKRSLLKFGPVSQAASLPASKPARRQAGSLAPWLAGRLTDRPNPYIQLKTGAAPSQVLDCQPACQPDSAPEHGF